MEFLPGTGTNSFVLGIFVEVRRPKKRMPRTKRPFVRPVAGHFWLKDVMEGMKAFIKIAMEMAVLPK